MKIMGKVKIRRQSFQAHIHTIVPPETVYFFFNIIVFICFIEHNLRAKISEKNYVLENSEHNLNFRVW